jgi:uncharacterized protein (DUF2147 family)
MCFLSFSLTTGRAQSTIEGDWKDPKNGAIISIYQENGKFYGQLKASEDPKAQKRIESQGKIILLKDFEQDDETSYCCGTIYQPKKKKTISATLYLEDNNTLRIEGRYGPFKGSQVWTRN